MSLSTLIAGILQAAVMLAAISAAWASLKGKMERLADDVSEIRKTTLPRIHERLDSQEGWRERHQATHDERDRRARERSMTEPGGHRT